MSIYIIVAIIFAIALTFIGLIENFSSRQASKSSNDPSINIEPITTLENTDMKTKILFILKYREISDPDGGGVYSTSSLSSGLLNSARMVKEMFDLRGIHDKHCEAKLVQVVDNNCIDREVTLFKPDIVIIEAIWVVPEKFDVLHKLHPNVKWIIRNHSNIPFLSQEGSAMGWIAEYVKKPNVYVATNTMTSLADLKDLVTQTTHHENYGKIMGKVVYFPNFYIPHELPNWKFKDKKEIHVGCFGAIRPLKNHIEQAIAAIRFARKHHKHLYFHINSSRIEGGGSPILKNLQALFANSTTSTLVEHQWTPHAEFVKVIAAMDISVQVSFSETFNIVTADAVMMGVPVVVSSEVFWIPAKYQANPVSADDIVKKMETAMMDSKAGEHSINQNGLESYNNRSHIAISNAIQTVLNHHHHH